VLFRDFSTTEIRFHTVVAKSNGPTAPPPLGGERLYFPGCGHREAAPDCSLR